jgi:lipopolysaccharide biosynthesis regulator YciM
MPDNQPNREQLLKMAIQAARNQQSDGARVMFSQVLKDDPRNERAMMWMAKLAGSQNERTKWLQRALKVNPKNTQAKAALNKIERRAASSDNQTLLIAGAVLSVLITIVIVVIVVGLYLSN